MFISNLISPDPSTITEWITAVGATIGMVLAIFSILKLIKKDTEKERKILSLEQIAFRQSEMNEKLQGQIDELANQTAAFQRQAELMADANHIAQKSYDLLLLQFNQSSKVELEKFELEKLKRLAEIKPYFLTEVGGSSPTEFHYSLRNKGNDAKMVYIQIPDDSWAFIFPISEETVETGEPLTIRGRAEPTKTAFNSNQVPFDLELLFEDQDGNKYKQDIIRSKAGSVQVSPPQLIERIE